MFVSKIVPAICLAGLPLLVAVHGSSLPSSLPAQCTDYMILDEASRSASEGGCETPSQCFCDKQTNEVAYWIISNSSFIQYCNSNIGLFSIAPPLVIALTRS
jgi:hypothetical protein